jgi:hypothetical protein
MGLSKDGMESAWRNASKRKKVDLYKNHPEWQEFFMNLAGDKLFLLEQLSGREGMDAFAYIKQRDAREAILRHLTSESRKKVEEELGRRALLKCATSKRLSYSELSQLPAESGGFSTLPAELVLEIAQNAPDLSKFMATNRRHFEISAEVLVRRVKDGGDIRRPCIALLRISRRLDIGESVHKLCENARPQLVGLIRVGAIKTVESNLKDISRLLLRVGAHNESFLDVVTAIRTQVTKNIEVYDSETATLALDLLKLSPLNTNILDDYFAEVVTAIRISAVRALGFFKISWVRSTLKLTKHLPPNTKISDDCFLDVATAIRARAVRHIRNSDFSEAEPALGLIEHLPSHTKIPDGSFLDVVTAIRTQAIRYLENDHLPKAELTLKLIARLPCNTNIPEDDFFDIVTAIRKKAVKCMECSDSNEVKSALELMKQLPSSMKPPEDFFVDIATAIPIQALRDLDDEDISAESVLRLLEHLPPNTNIPKHGFVDVMTRIRMRAIQALEGLNVYKTQSIHCDDLVETALLLQLIKLLPPSLDISDDCCLDVVKAIRTRAIRYIGDCKPITARRTLKLIQHLPPNTSIPKDYFLEAVTSSTASLISQAPYNTRVPDDYLLSK